MFEQAPAGNDFAYGSKPLTSPSPALYELRPLSLGEILDRTFSLYRRNFWLFCGLSALAAAFSTLVELIRLTFMGLPAQAAVATAAVPGTMPGTRATLIAGGVAIAVAMLYFMAFAYIQAATISAVSSVYLGHVTSIGIALKAVRRTWYRYILISIWQAWSGMWLFFTFLFLAGISAVLKVPAVTVLLFFLAFASVIYGVIAYLRNSLAISASVVESSKIRASMRRSKVLAAENKWRIFLLLLLVGVLNMTAGGLQIPFAFFLLRSHGGQRFLAEGLTLIMGFVTNSLIGPIAAIALCLIYIDTRVRKEGFDIEALMDRTLGAPMRPRVEPPPLGVLPSGFAPSGFTAEVAPPPPHSAPVAQAEPFAPSGFAASSAPAEPFAPSGFTVPVNETPTPDGE